MPKKFDLEKLVLSRLREISHWWPPANEALQKARVGFGAYACASCTNMETLQPVFRRGEVQRDHIVPVGRKQDGEGTWDGLFKRMFPPVEGYQILCIPCHQIKSQKDMAELRRNRRKK